MKWMPIETMTDDDAIETHVRGLMVRNNKTGAKWWEAIAGYVNDDGYFIDHSGDSPWHVDDYSHWMPLPPAPGEA